jgi:hypothetical protein
MLEIIVVALSTRHILIFFFSIENRCKGIFFFVISKCMYGNTLNISLSFSKLTCLIYTVYCVLSVFAAMTIAPIFPSAYCFVASKSLLIEVFDMNLYC